VTRIALIGCGRAAELLYLPALKRIQSITVAGVVDPLEERRSLMAAHFPGAQSHDSLGGLLKNAALDAVIITTPPETHVQVALSAIEAGLGVLVEKPLALSMDGLVKLRDLIHTRNTTLMVGFNRRFWQPVQALKRALAALEYKSGSGRFELITRAVAWQSISHASNPLDDLGSHLIDLAHFIFDDRTTAVSARWQDGTIDFQLELSRGISVACRAGYRDSYSEQYHVHLNGRSYRVDDGSERIEPASGLPRYASDLADSLLRRVKRQKSSLRLSYQAEIETFVRAIEQHKPVEPGIQAGIAAVKTAQALRESAAADGKKIQIDWKIR
jgi:predicted dehydrogenase